MLGILAASDESELRDGGFDMPDLELSGSDFGGSMWEKTTKYWRSPITNAFHESRAKIRFLEGRYSNGKSLSAAVDLFMFMPQRQQRDRRGRRQLPTAVVRRTSTQLIRTTLRSLIAAAPPGFRQVYRRTDRTLHTRGRVGDDIFDIFMDLFGLNLDGQRDNLRSWNGACIFASEFADLMAWVLDIGRIRHGFGGIVAEGNPGDEGGWITRFVRAPTESEYERFAESGFILSDGRETATPTGGRRPFCELFICESGESAMARAALEQFGLSPDFYSDMKRTHSPEQYRRFGLGRRGVLKAERPIYIDFAPSFHCRDSLPIIQQRRGIGTLFLGMDADSSRRRCVGATIDAINCGCSPRVAPGRPWGLIRSGNCVGGGTLLRDWRMPTASRSLVRAIRRASRRLAGFDAAFIVRYSIAA